MSIWLPTFDHNLCFRCPNGSCKTILNIYILIAFQWYKELFKVMGFDPCNCFLKIQESTGTPTPKMGVHLGVWVYILTLSHTTKFFSWPALLQTLALVTSPRLGLQQCMGVNNEHVLSNLACIIIMTLWIVYPTFLFNLNVVCNICNSYFIFEVLKLHFFVKFGQDIYYLFIW